jgi:hypothetical protein
LRRPARSVAQRRAGPGGYLDHDIQSQEAVILTLTFSGTRLVQVGLDPTVMVDGAQVALLDPAGDGHTVLDAIRRASRGLLGW